MTDNAPYLVQELDRLSAARDSAPGDQAAEMALWEQAAKLGLWFIVNRGTAEQPQPMVLQPPGLGLLAAVFSCRERAVAQAGGGEVLGVPMPAALDWLASFGERGVTGVVLDQNTIGAWIPLANLGYLKRWVPAEGHAVIGSAPAPIAPEVREALDAYAERDDDESYDDVLRHLASSELLVVMDPSGNGHPTHIPNGRGDRTVLAFTGLDRLQALYGGRQVDVRKADGATILALVCSEYDALGIDAQHPSQYVATPDRILTVLGD